MLNSLFSTLKLLRKSLLNIYCTNLFKFYESFLKDVCHPSSIDMNNGQIEKCLDV